MSVNPADLGGPFRTVFDVGAFRGDFARACQAEWPDCSVHSFEPLEQQPAIPATRTGDNRRRWQWYAVALGPEFGTVTMTKCPFVPSSSVLEMAELHEAAFPYAPRGGEHVVVRMHTLDQYVAEIQPPALLKVDVQGYELEVLRGAEDALAEFAAVVLEVSHAELYHDAPTPGEIAEFLSAAGFMHQARVDALYHPKNPRQLLQSDELWVR